jgi:hypothetical protein
MGNDQAKEVEGSEAIEAHLDIHQDAVDFAVCTSLQLVETLLSITCKKDFAAFLDELASQHCSVDLVVLRAERRNSAPVSLR